MGSLVIAEHDNQHMHASTKNTLTAAMAFASPITLLIIGYQCHVVVTEATTLSGISTILVVDDIHYQHVIAEKWVNVIMHIISKHDDYSAILAPATTFGKNILPKVAALLDVAQIS